MSVQNESLDMKSSERKPAAPELEYKAASQDSLSMFFAAIGGAVLGMLATLLVLAIINGGTLNFTHPERLAVMEANLARVNENVGAVSQNVDTVASQVTDVRDQLAVARSQMDAAQARLDDQSGKLDAVQGSVAALALTGQKFDTFVAALDQAMVSMRKLDGSAETTTPAAIAAKPLLVSDPAVQADAVAVLFFVDGNGNGVMDDAEANLTGVVLRVTDAAGNQVGEYTSGDAGVLVQGLNPGDYTFAITDAAGHATLSEEVAVTVPADAAQGQILYVPMAE
ncbi:MAG TPA: hypothetical protein DCL15_00305 [Chloroflexi bacterium]|nr:hypothetical protein [Chloroflexota bacterium]HHW85984.1 hypothetical protein [Chloroflexota bacterium]